jgi:cysteine-rich repeat protein
MRLRTLGLAAVLAAGIAQPSGAVVRPKNAEPPVVAAGRTPRLHRDAQVLSPARAIAAGLPGWIGLVDHDTDVPLEMWGRGIVATGAQRDASVAAASAQAFLAAHLAALAPGASLSDFVMVANDLDPKDGVRSVGFQQYASGAKVIGAHIGVMFEHDKLVLVTSTAIPDVFLAPAPAARLPTNTVAANAITWLAGGGKAVRATGGLGDRVVLPIVHTRGWHPTPQIEYRLAEAIDVEAIAAPGKWTVWVDAATGAPLARRTHLHYTSGTVAFDVVDRAPVIGRDTLPAPHDNHTVNGSVVESDELGVVTWTGSADATVLPGLSGQYVNIINEAGSVDTGSLDLPPNGQAVWSQATDPNSDAQLISFVHANKAKAFVKAQLAPELAWLDESLDVHDNENDTCNAYSTGDDVHFFQADTQCENTGRIADVVYHEFGHSVHAHLVIDGVGEFNDDNSEGYADTMAASITGDSGMGRGFFYTSDPLRELNPTVKKVYPQDYDGEPHDDGEIIGETLWDLRSSLQTSLGTDAGFAQFLVLFHSALARSFDLPSTYGAVLVGDDDDGDLSNGTPNFCNIQAAFAAHGLADPTATLGLAPPTRDDFNVTFDATPSSISCPDAQVPTVSSATLTWRVKGGTDADVAFTAAGSTYTSAIPTQPDGTTVEYKVTVTLSTGGTLSYPDNPADPYYVFYVGQTTPIWCADFESGDFGDWTHTASPSAQDQWEVGMPTGAGGDPRMAHGGSYVLGMELEDGTYYPQTTSSATSGMIDVSGYAHVHLQYWRWLGVEDGYYESAPVSVNGAQIWTNAASPQMPQAVELNHIDKEWRFQDFDVSAAAATGKIQLQFGLTSDEALEFGGWTLDDVCLVTTDATSSNAVCGNGVVETGEQCDDGNTASGDGCSSTCQHEGPSGDDDGNDEGSSGCCSSSGHPLGSISLAAFCVGLVLRRRRRR